MNLPLITTYTIGIATLDRLGGSYSKAFRRYGIPSAIYLLHPTSLQHAIASIMLAVLFSLNLDEIEQRNWEEIYLYSIALAFCTYIYGDWLCILPSSIWLLGIYLSNIGLNGWRLDWRYVEIARGAAIGLAATLLL